MKKNNLHPCPLHFSFLLIFSLLSFASFGQQVEKGANSLEEESEFILSLDIDAYMSELADTPRRKKGKADSKEKTVSLPMASGAERGFYIVENNLMAPEFAAEYPEIKTYSIQAVGDPSVSGSLTLSPFGLQATILSHEGMVYIHPVDLLNPVQHRVTLSTGPGHLDCGVTESALEFELNESMRANGLSHGATLHTYTLAIVTTGEFHDENGGTVAAATTVVTNSVNSIQAIYERDLAVNFTLLTPHIYTNPATDPFVNSSNRTTQAAEAVEANFPGGAGGAYDIGHVFHDQSPTTALGSGGVAGLGVVCSNFPIGTGFNKGRGWSGSFNNTSAGWIDLAAHEFGHMFNMPHTFNGDGNSNCNNNIASTNSYEIASGTTIMSYNGICGTGQNIPNGGAADHYFHIVSLEQAVAKINGTSCATTSATGNTPPVVNANSCGGAYTIPVSTPFRLVGTGSDADGDQIYYSWEQYDEDGADTPTQGFIGAQAAGSTIAPLFRSYPPTTDPVRYFPNKSLIAANSYASDFEPLPTVARTLNFRLTGRDWKMGGGGIHCSPLAVTVSAAGPLSVTAPNGGGTLTAGGNATVTWAVNGTNAISTNVNIKMSVDGGTTYPYTLASGVANDGSQSVTIPSGAPNTAEARIMVESADNTCVVFFDISNANFTVTSSCNTEPHYICDVSPVSAASGNGALNLASPDIIYGKPTTTFTMTPSGSSSMGVNISPQSPGAGTCTGVNFGYGFERKTFFVSETGDYTFSKTGGFSIMTVYSAPFSTGSVCTNYIGSNAWDTDGTPEGSVTASSSVGLTLTACTEYEIVYWSSGAATDITVAGPGIFYSNDGNLPANYTQTYVAVNTSTGNIAAVSPTANFTSLTTGTYQVYGANYYSSTAPPTPGNPGAWVGSSISTIMSGGSCVLFSGNSKPVTVTGGGGGTPSLSISGSPIMPEGNSGTTVFTYPVARTGNTANASSVNWAVTGSASNPANAADFDGGVLPSGTLNFPAGSSASQIITINVNGDTDVETDEGFVVTLSAPTNATIGTGTAVGTIQNDDMAATPSLAIAATSADKAEGNAGNNPFTFTVARTGNTASASSASWAVTGSGGNPANATDFAGGTFPSGTVTFPAGSSASQTITVNVNGDTDVEPDEGFTVTLSSPSNATISTATATGTIQNDDAANTCSAVSYCAPSQTTGSCTSPDEFISNVTFNTIVNNSSCAESLPGGYTDYTSMGTNVDIGSSYPLNVTNGGPFTTDQCIAWFDWNGNGDFTDAGEEFVLTGSGVNSAENWTVNVTVPSTATVGSTRMRVRIKWNGTPTPCGSQSYSEAEDYCITINDNNCPLTRDVAGATTTGTYQAEQTLTADGTVGSGQVVQFKAGTSVTLEPNFEVILNGELDVTIENCAAPLGGNGGGE